MKLNNIITLRKLMEGGGPGSGRHPGLVPAKYHNGKHTLMDGSPVPPHIAKLRIPSAWTNVQVNKDKADSLWVKGLDAKNRVQSIYSPKFRNSKDNKDASIRDLADTLKGKDISHEDNHLALPEGGFIKLTDGNQRWKRLLIQKLDNL